MRPIAFLLIVLCSISSVSAEEQTEKWQSLKSQAAQIRQSEPTFALLKLHQAWSLLSKKSPELATKELQNEVAKTYGVQFPSAERNCAKLTAEQFQAFMNGDKFSQQWELWTITKKGDALVLNTPIENLGRSSQCTNGLLSVSPATAETRKQFEKALPIVINFSDEKFKDLLSFAEPIKTGEEKKVTFDLNPFVPKEFQNLAMP